MPVYWSFDLIFVRVAGSSRRIDMAKTPLTFTYYIAAPVEKVWDGFDAWLKRMA
jgi:hypothetical protein